jgi:hypothetical protein
MLRVTIGMVLLVSLIALTQCSYAATIFYNGDYVDGANISCERNTTVSDSRVYENFSIESSRQVTGIFGNFISDKNNAVHRAYYEIRQGITPDSGGALVSSGELTATSTAIAQSGWSWCSIYMINATPTGLTLGPGSYWFTLAPIGESPQQWTLLASSGANSVGTTDRLSYWDSVFWDRHWESNFGYPAYGGWSMGITGSVVPEPAGIIPLFSGLLGVMASALRQRPRRVVPLFRDLRSDD